MISAVVVGPRVGFVFQTLAPGPALIHVAPGFGGVLGNQSGVRQPALVVRPTLPSRPLDQRDSSGPEASPRGPGTSPRGDSRDRAGVRDPAARAVKGLRAGEPETAVRGRRNAARNSGRQGSKVRERLGGDLTREGRERRREQGTHPLPRPDDASGPLGARRLFAFHIDERWERVIGVTLYLPIGNGTFPDPDGFEPFKSAGWRGEDSRARLSCGSSSGSPGPRSPHRSGRTGRR